MKKDSGNKYQTTHELILSKGMSLLFERGYDAVGIPDICKEAGISRQNFYLHFKNKDELIANYYAGVSYFSDQQRSWILNADSPWSSLLRLQMLILAHTCNPDHKELIRKYVAYALLDENFQNSPLMPPAFENLQMDLIRSCQRQNLIAASAQPFHLNSSLKLLQWGTLYQWCSTKNYFSRWKDFFWSMESCLQVREDLRGLWKAEEYYFPDLTNNND